MSRSALSGQRIGRANRRLLQQYRDYRPAADAVTAALRESAAGGGGLRKVESTLQRCANCRAYHLRMVRGILQITYSAACSGADGDHDFSQGLSQKAQSYRPGCTHTGERVEWADDPDPLLLCECALFSQQASNSMTKCCGNAVPPVSIRPILPGARRRFSCTSSGLSIAGMSARLIASPKHLCMPLPQ